VRNFPVLRSEKSGDEYELRAFNVFGPKILSTRRTFEVEALETRCLTLRTGDYRIQPDIPRQLHAKFYAEGWHRATSCCVGDSSSFRIKPDESQLLALEPRIEQIGTALYAVSTDDGFV